MFRERSWFVHMVESVFGVCVRVRVRDGAYEYLKLRRLAILETAVKYFTV